MSYSPDVLDAYYERGQAEEIEEIDPRALLELLRWMNAEGFLDHELEEDEFITLLDSYVAWKRGY